jgi:hypothetical protein
MQHLPVAQTTRKSRRRFKQTLSLKERLLIASRQARDRADMLPPGTERQVLLRLARQTKITADLEAWLSSPGLRLPK